MTAYPTLGGHNGRLGERAAFVPGLRARALRGIGERWVSAPTEGICQ